MKPKIYLVSIMAFSLGITLTAQTIVSADQKTPSHQLTTNSGENKRTLSRVGGKTVPDNMSAENPIAVKSANISGESERNELLKLAEALAYQARRLRSDADKKEAGERESLLVEAAQFEKNSRLKQIKASEILGTICQVKFNSNKESINKLIAGSKTDEGKMTGVRSLISSSEKKFASAKNLREESGSKSDLEEKIVMMNKAEDLELQALTEQSKVIELLWQKPKTE